VEAYLEHDVFVFPSYHEGFPLSVLEAMVMGLPVLATRVGALPEIVDEGKGGWLVDTGDVEAIAAIISAIENRKQLLAMGLYNRIKVHQNYRFSIVAARVKQIYDVLRKDQYWGVG
jgi:glycosyltransferase involved in cell wall biosynthesis